MIRVKKIKEKLTISFEYNLGLVTRKFREYDSDCPLPKTIPASLRPTRNQASDSCVTGNLQIDELCVSTMCSGSGGGELAVRAFAEAFEDCRGKPLATSTPFACECTPFKQMHLKKLLQHLHSEDGSFCLFDDVTTMGTPDSRRIHSLVKTVASKLTYTRSPVNAYKFNNLQLTTYLCNL